MIRHFLLLLAIIAGIISPAYADDDFAKNNPDIHKYLLLELHEGYS